jgi:hypothetical protein
MTLIELLEWFASEMKRERYNTKERRIELEKRLENMGVVFSIVKAISATIDDNGEYIRMKV